MIRIICHGYKDSNDKLVTCGKVIGEKDSEGGDSGDSHTYCDDCFQKQMEACNEYFESAKSFAESGTYVFGSSKEIKTLRVQAIALGKSAYESAA